MRAILCREFCTPEVLDWAETDDPVPGPEVVVMLLRGQLRRYPDHRSMEKRPSRSLRA